MTQLHGPTIVDNIQTNPLNSRNRRALRQYHYNKQDGKCIYCGCEMLPQQDPKNPNQARATLEHLIPQCQNGENIVENTACSCKQCNHDRGSMDHDTFATIRRMAGYHPQILHSIQRGARDLDAALEDCRIRQIFQNIPYVNVLKSWMGENGNVVTDAMIQRHARYVWRKRKEAIKTQWAYAIWNQLLMIKSAMMLVL